MRLRVESYLLLRTIRTVALTSRQAREALGCQTTQGNITMQLQALERNGFAFSSLSSQPRKPRAYMATAKGKEALLNFEDKVHGSKGAAA